MEERKLTCIGCPMGCALTARLGEDGEWQISGNTCPRGASYAKTELTNPRRIVTSSVPVVNGKQARVSIKTCRDIPKDKIFDCIRALKELRVTAPVSIGDVVLADVAHTGVNVVSTKKVDAKEPFAG